MRKHMTGHHPQTTNWAIKWPSTDHALSFWSPHMKQTCPMIFLIPWIQSWDLWSKYQFVTVVALSDSVFILNIECLIESQSQLMEEGEGWSVHIDPPPLNDNGLLMYFVSHHSLMLIWKYSIVFCHHNWLLSIAAGTIHISGAHGQHALYRLHGDATADARLQSYGAWKKISDCRKQWLGVIKCLQSQALELH
jgi:hypothetical protein